ncbi:MAG: hypothetical protein QME16_05000, partial [Planctomycetota bacterium]|nr:hypothetical protein [Planctomycetota bacterium]
RNDRMGRFARVQIVLISALSLFFISCSTTYDAAREDFYKGVNLYYNHQSPEALLNYCRSLGQIENEIKRDSSLGLLKSAVYYHLYLIDAPLVYHNCDAKTKPKYISFAGLLSDTVNKKLLELAFKEVISLEKDLRKTDIKTIEPLLLIHRDLIIADELSDRITQQNYRLLPEDISPPADFINTIMSYSYGDIIRAFYLDAWALSLRQCLKVDDAKDVRRTSNNFLYNLSMNKLKQIYSSLSRTTAPLKTTTFLNLNNHYSEVAREIDTTHQNYILGNLTLLLDERGYAEILGEGFNRNDLILDPEAYLREARGNMNSAIEMIVTDRIDKAENHLLLALKNIICFNEFSSGEISAENRRLVQVIMSDILINLYRIHTNAKK